MTVAPIFPHHYTKMANLEILSLVLCDTEDLVRLLISDSDTEDSLELVMSGSEPEELFNVNTLSVTISQKVMCHISPVFKAMLTGGFNETDASEITLHGDDEFALLTVLKIAHIGGKRALQKLTCCQLHEIAVVCDKYDCVVVVRPFFYLWDAPYGLMDGTLLPHTKCLSAA
jgi:hypothetical protein